MAKIAVIGGSGIKDSPLFKMLIGKYFPHGMVLLGGWESGVSGNRKSYFYPPAW